jgi:hypothetical protein
MDNATVLHACRRARSCVAHDSSAWQTGDQGGHGENSVTENARLLDDWRPLTLNERNLKPSPHRNVMLREIAKGGSAADVR